MLHLNLSGFGERLARNRAYHSVYALSYPELMHPKARAINTDLPKPPKRTHFMIDFAVSWAEIPEVAGDRYHQRYPDESIATWHERLKLTD
ncbi:MAG: hypothetical protein CLLPBCKN_006383 [Chroococcidiopsis cubana SAG 39.79]|uniref:Uncharacterized protein n=1 Tax=Chroococcidiopsis cubana SAG 39.79 TaxID=388085 RepID=A0AB37UBZ4_9CYAN|nr:hypothetical protein [Chroococcidiopsis cubana]MDZ4876948.1 hypothetical protein [Chroococcidiopsis cubana SAG 39.79]PSB63494.1 hypothetical protein C7B79_13725 [Chroococcidiopsis cubana CCALA 043]RUT02640.1 hypothetical protein DSM107010_62180 [Chroococcidiopsis cubana SAG 39.79]